MKSSHSVRDRDWWRDMIAQANFMLLGDWVTTTTTTTKTTTTTTTTTIVQSISS